jgi:hypothetical protein
MVPSNQFIGFFESKDHMILEMWHDKACLRMSRLEQRALLSVVQLVG